MTDAEPPPRVLELSADAVVAPIILAARDALDVVGLGLEAIDRADFAALPGIPGSPLRVEFTIHGETEGQRRDRYRAWLLAKGFHELARGVRLVLEEAHLYCQLVSEADDIRTVGELEEAVGRLRLQGNRFNNDQLVRAVDGGLTEPIALGEQLASLQKVRNCLEHRDGLVGTKDADANGLLELSLPFMKIFSRDDDGAEVELRPGQVFERARNVMTRRDIRRRQYRLGDRVAFIPSEFAEIAHGCHLLGVDVGARLPLRVPPEAQD